MKERSSPAGNVTTKQLQRIVSLNTKERYMKERSIHAGNVTIRQLHMVNMPQELHPIENILVIS
jgi:hypothetical protein